MKKKLIIGIIIGLVLYTISSCSFMGTSITDRIGYFIVDLNSSRTNIIDNFHDAANNYDNLDANYFEKGFLYISMGPHSITGISVSGSTVTGTLNYNDGGAQSAPIILEMRDAGDIMGENWKIYSFTVDGATQFN